MDGMVLSIRYGIKRHDSPGASSRVVQGGGGLGAINPERVGSWGSGRKLSKRRPYLAQESEIRQFQEKLKLHKIKQNLGASPFSEQSHHMHCGSECASLSSHSVLSCFLCCALDQNREDSG